MCLITLAKTTRMIFLLVELFIAKCLQYSCKTIYMQGKMEKRLTEVEKNKSNQIWEEKNNN